MGKYRKKPIIVDAVKVKDVLKYAKTNWKELNWFIKENYETGKIAIANDRILINTEEGNMTAGKDDYILRGQKGEIYPCKKKIFEDTYERVDL